MITSVRVATRADAAALAALVDSQELGVDPNATPMTEANAIKARHVAAHFRRAEYVVAGRGVLRVRQ